MEKENQMPYIELEKRDEFDACGIDAIAAGIENTGDFNYVISYLANHMVNYGPIKSYSALSAICGAISDAAKEFYRRVMVPFEEQKIRENGDVYGTQL